MEKQRTYRGRPVKGRRRNATYRWREDGSCELYQGGGMPMSEWMTSSSLGVCRVLTRVNVTYLKIIVWRER